jgi:MtfA peptidase
MVFGWFRKRKRKRLLAEPFPESWEQILNRDFQWWPALSAEEQSKLRAAIRIFTAEKNWEGCRGQVITDEVQVLIAAQACLLGLGFEELYFDHVPTILVYPDAYRAPDNLGQSNWIQTEGGSPRMGEAWWQGPVILSWKHSLEGARGDAEGDNLVLHEFAHQLDMLNGRSVDGTPPLSDSEQLDRWVEVMTAAYRQLIRDCRRGRPGVMSCYGTTNEGEFFAVATESFFSQPLDFQLEAPELYDLFAEFYRQDPAARAARLSRR